MSSSRWCPTRQEDEQKRSRHVSWWLFLPDVSEKVQEWQNFKAIETSGAAVFVLSQKYLKKHVSNGLYISGTQSVSF